MREPKGQKTVEERKAEANETAFALCAVMGKRGDMKARKVEPAVERWDARAVAKAIRSVLKRNGFRGCTARLSRSRYVDVYYAGFVPLFHLPDGNQDRRLTFEANGRIREAVKGLILDAMPNLDDRSDYGTDYYDFVFSMHNAAAHIF